MKLSDEIKKKIEEEQRVWIEKQYCNQSKEERMKRGAYYTPYNLVIKMIEKFPDLDGQICDPCLGAGHLIAGCIIAGADPKLCYGIEIDKDTYEFAVNRLSTLGVPKENIFLGSCFDNDIWEKIEGKKKFRFGVEPSK